MKEKFVQYSDINSHYGLSHNDYHYFGYREPCGYDKVRLISKVQHQVFWLFRKVHDSSLLCSDQDESTCQKQEEQFNQKFFII